MPIDDQQIRLVWSSDVSALESSRKSTEALRAGTYALKDAMGEAAASMNRASSSSDALSANTYELDDAFGVLTRQYYANVEASEKAEQAARELAAQQDRLQKEVIDNISEVARLDSGLISVGASKIRVAEGSRNLVQSTIGLSRAFQDFAQGGLYATINNLEQIAFVGGPLVAAAATAIGTAVYLATPHIMDFVRSLDAVNQVPVADSLGAMNKELDGVNKRLEELRGRQLLTNEELVEFNRLTNDSVNLARELAKAEAMRKAVETTRTLPADAIGMRKGAIEDVVKEFSRRRGDPLGPGSQPDMRAILADVIQLTRGDFGKGGFDRSQAAADALIGSAALGYKAAYDQIIDLLQVGGERGQQISERLIEKSPENQRLIEAAKEQNKLIAEERKRREDVQKSINEAIDFFDQLGETPQQAKAREKREAAEAKKAQKAAGAEEATDIFIEQALAEEEAQRMDAVIANYLETKRLNANVRAMQQELMSQMVILSEEERLEAIEYMRQTDEFNRQVRAIRRTRQRRGR